MIYEGKDFKKDNFYTGGDIISSDAKSSNGAGHALYKTARFGDFSYEFPDMEDGVYYVDLHLAETEFVNGPSEMRVFDVYIPDIQSFWRSLKEEEDVGAR